MDTLMEAYLEHVPSPELLPEPVWSRCAALNTWGTNAIEGNTLERPEVEGLLFQDRAPPHRPVGDIVETLQHAAVFRELPSRRHGPSDLATVLELHESVFRGNVHAAPGRWRRVNGYIAGSRHRPPRHEKVVPLMERWLDGWHARLDRGADTFGSIAWMHQVFEEIHPFADGNGRVGRLLVNLHLLIEGWPPLHVLPRDRTAYLRALEAGSARDGSALERFFAVRMGCSLLDLLDQVGSDEDALRPLAAFSDQAWNPFDANYLGLRARTGGLPAIARDETSGPRSAHPGANRTKWLTSERALKAYVREAARHDACARLGEDAWAALAPRPAHTAPPAPGTTHL